MSFWDFVPTMISAGVTLYGANSASKASNKSASQLNAANQGATAAELAGLQAAQTSVAQNQKAASPGLLAYQAMVNRGSALTPEQEQAVEDSRRQAMNALQGSALRGSARATSAILADTDKRVRNNFMTQNKNTANAAAAGLAGQYFQAGNNLSNIYAKQGETSSQGLMNAGIIDSSNTQGQAKIQGEAIGKIGAVIADEAKKSSYDKIFGGA